MFVTVGPGVSWAGIGPGGLATEPGKVVEVPAMIGGGTETTRSAFKAGMTEPDRATTMDPGKGRSSYPVGFAWDLALELEPWVPDLGPRR